MLTVMNKSYFIVQMSHVHSRRFHQGVQCDIWRRNRVHFILLKVLIYLPVNLSNVWKLKTVY